MSDTDAGPALPLANPPTPSLAPTPAEPPARARLNVPPPTPATPQPSLFERALAGARIMVPDFPTLHRKDDVQTYLHRLIGVLGNLSVSDFDAIGADFKQWFNDSVDALNDRQKAPLPEGFGGAPSSKRARPNGVDKPAKVAQRNLTKLAPAPKAKSVKQVAAPKASPVLAPVQRTAPAPRKAKVKGAVQIKRDGADYRRGGGRKIVTDRFTLRGVCSYIVTHPNTSVDELAALAVKNKVELRRSSLVSVLANTLMVINAVKAAGHWRELRGG